MTETRQAGPQSITLVRHGQSVANVAEDRADRHGWNDIDIRVREPDIELSSLGRRQARALGRWVAAAPEQWRPTTVFSSPYRRALQTAEPTLIALGLEVLTDERLRERELGMFDGVTLAGMQTRAPAEAERHALAGRFYYRPPGGESWPDVMLRVGSFMGDLRSGYHDERVWIVAHRETIMAFRAVMERLPESRLLTIDETAPVTNASLTRYLRQGADYSLDTYADRTALAALENRDHDEAARSTARVGARSNGADRRRSHGGAVGRPQG